MKILTMLSKYQFIKSALLVLPLGLLSSFTFAQNNSASNPALSYPTKPIKFIVAFAPGGPADDIIARLLGQKLG